MCYRFSPTFVILGLELNWWYSGAAPPTPVDGSMLLAGPTRRIKDQAWASLPIVLSHSLDSYVFKENSFTKTRVGIVNRVHLTVYAA